MDDNKKYADQPLRSEEEYSNTIEKYIGTLCSNAELNAAKHDEAGYHFKARKVWFGLPQTIIPLIMAPVTMGIGPANPAIIYVSATALLLSGLSSGIYTFFNYGETTTNHFHHSSLYADLASDIRSEMIKSRPYRQQADVFISRTQMRFDNLMKDAPVIPKGVIAMVEKKYVEKSVFM